MWTMKNNPPDTFAASLRDTKQPERETCVICGRKLLISEVPAGVCVLCGEDERKK